MLSWVNPSFYPLVLVEQVPVLTGPISLRNFNQYFSKMLPRILCRSRCNLPPLKANSEYMNTRATDEKLTSCSIICNAVLGELLGQGLGLMLNLVRG